MPLRPSKLPRPVLRLPALHLARVAAAGFVAMAIVALPMTGAPAQAQTATGQPYLAPGTTESLITDPVDKARYDRLAHELRCLVCQNQSLAESNASLAADLRRQVESMILEGRSDAQIKSYLVDRYGDFVLYRPPMKSNTWLLWFGPFVLMTIGIAIWFGIGRRRGRGSDASLSPAAAAGSARNAVPAEGAGAATAADIERVRRLLDGN